MPIGSLMHLPFMDESFETYVSNLALHHAEDHQAVINECYRVLKADGFGAFSVPLHSTSDGIFSAAIKIILDLGIDIPQDYLEVKFDLDEMELRSILRETGF